jgi:hypothetical protein
MGIVQLAEIQAAIDFMTSRAWSSRTLTFTQEPAHRG